jgi:hypothetical protein
MRNLRQKKQELLKEEKNTCKLLDLRSQPSHRQRAVAVATGVPEISRTCLLVICRRNPLAAAAMTAKSWQPSACGMAPLAVLNNMDETEVEGTWEIDLEDMRQAYRYSSTAP